MCPIKVEALLGFGLFAFLVEFQRLLLPLYRIHEVTGPRVRGSQGV
jgi:hypothetical protein